MNIAREVVDRSMAYLCGEITAAEFANGFHGVLKAAAESAESNESKAALRIHAYHAHYFSGMCTEDEMRSLIADSVSFTDGEFGRFAYVQV